MSDEQDQWLAKKLLDENSLAIRTVWDLYLKFYTVFLTFSVVALGLTIQQITRGNRWPIVVAFVIQNILSGITAFAIAKFSKISTKRYEDICKHILDKERRDAGMAEHCKSPFPGWLGELAGYANMLSHITLIACWVAVVWV